MLGLVIAKQRRIPSNYEPSPSSWPPQVRPKRWRRPREPGELYTIMVYATGLRESIPDRGVAPTKSEARSTKS